MIERKQGNWISMQASVGMHCDLFDSNSRFLSKPKDDDNSEGFRFYTGDCDEQYPLHHPHGEHTLNFADLQHCLLAAQPPSHTPFPLPPHSPPQEHDWATDALYKRGLKSLASLLLKAFFKRRFSSLREVINQIELQLLPPAEVLVNKKEQKNIKRRIYDALNVMLSAGILQKGMFALANTQESSKNYGFVCRKSECAHQIVALEARLESKRELLKSLVSKRQAIADWTARKKQAASQQKQAKTQQKQQRQQQKHQNQYQRQQQRQQERLHFPLIIMCWGREAGCIELQYGGETLAVGYKGAEVYSETDLLEQLMLRTTSSTNSQLTKIQFLDEITYI